MCACCVRLRLLTSAPDGGARMWNSTPLSLQGICAAADPATAAVQYKAAGWAAHAERM